MTGHARAAAAPSWRIRPLQEADLPGVVRIERRAFSLPWPRSAFDMALRVAGVDGLVVVDDEERPRGYLIAAYAAAQMLVANLAVDPDWRRRGLARALLERALAEARGRGVRLCRLEVRRSNRAAIRLYEQAGFRAIGVQRDYYRKPREDALTMLRLLAPAAVATPGAAATPARGAGEDPAGRRQKE